MLNFTYMGLGRWISIKLYLIIIGQVDLSKYIYQRDDIKMVTLLLAAISFSGKVIL